MDILWYDFHCGRISIRAVVAEWLRRLTRNQIPSGSVGSNPTDCEIFSALVIYVVEVKSSISIS